MQEPQSLTLSPSGEAQTERLSWPYCWLHCLVQLPIALKRLVQGGSANGAAAGGWLPMKVATMLSHLLWL